MNRDTDSAEPGPGAVSTTAMRCLIVVPSLRRAGAETQAVDLANGLAAMGHHIHLCCFERSLDQRSRLSAEVRFHHIMRNAKYDYSVVTRLAQIIDQEEIDILHGVLQFATLIAFLAARRSMRKPQVVAAVHTTVNRGMKQELQDRLLYRYILRQLPAVVFVCNHQRDHWVAKYRELKPLARVVHNRVDSRRYRREEFTGEAARLRRELRVPEESFVFTCIAGFRREKGHNLLVNAFARSPPGTYLLLAGDGELRSRTEELVRQAGLGERVRFLGNVSEIGPVVVASNATVLASTAVETFSMAMLESMALGVPMIAPRIGGLSEAIIPGETGLLFSVGDAQELSQAMGIMVTDRAAVARMGRAAHSKIVEQFTLQEMLEKSERVLLEVWGERTTSMRSIS